MFYVDPTKTGTFFSVIETLSPAMDESKDETAMDETLDETAMDETLDETAMDETIDETVVGITMYNL